MKHTAPNFDPLAKIYRWMEYLSFGRALERCRFYFLDSCTTASRALVLGDGDGRFTQRLAQKNSSVAIHALDASPRMLQELRERVATLGPQAVARLQTTVCDLRAFTPGADSYDLAVTHFFLDCLSELEIAALLERLRPALAQDATWVLSEFSIPQRGWMRQPARALIAALYLAFRWMTRLPVQRLPNPAPIFERAGFQLQERRSFLRGLLVAEVWRLRAR